MNRFKPLPETLALLEQIVSVYNQGWEKDISLAIAMTEALSNIYTYAEQHVSTSPEPSFDLRARYLKTSQALLLTIAKNHQQDPNYLTATASFFPKDVGGSPSANLAKGGIDFTLNRLPLTTRGEKIHIQYPQRYDGVDASMIEGFVPVLIEMAPVTDIPGLIGRRGR